MHSKGFLSFLVVSAACVGVAVASVPVGGDEEPDLVPLATNFVMKVPVLQRVPLAAFSVNTIEIKPIGHAQSLRPLIVNAWEIMAPVDGKRPLGETPAGRLYDQAHAALLRAGPDSAEYREAMAEYRDCHLRAIRRHEVFQELAAAREGALRAPSKRGP